jgi:hypothetical protein
MSAWKRVVALLAWSLSLYGLTPATASFAIDWERMVMPGPLVAAHEDLEKDCASCHQAFNVEAQRALCLACHELVADDIAGGVGFHSRNPLASTGQCKSCHPDHKGREADIMGLSEATFDHAQTDYDLVGRHASVACNDCHPANEARRDAATECYACHEDDDVHKGELSNDCGKCHDEIQWRTTRFDHDTTDYPLAGAHADASCAGCHVAQKYAGTPTDCISCHAIDDAHGGRFGKDCADCHTTTAWVKKGFDHERESGFALVGSHAEASCVTCHRQPPGERTLPETCSGCHANEDVHSGRFGAECGTCHASSTWDEVRFDHAKQTEFPLRAAHAQASCNACHTGRVAEQELAVDCYGCHRADDVHRGNLGKDCADCHGQDSFSGRVSFDHELTGFPLLGLHAMASCESCHRDHRFEEQKVACHSCHAVDDVHEGTLGARCEDCHNPNGWARWRFDHDRQTDFALDGAHEGLECAACHRTSMTNGARMADDCLDCHDSDDAHRGGFGRDCGDCHSSEAWAPATFGRTRGGKR